MFILVEVPTITLPAPHKGLLLLSAQNAKLLSVQNAKLLKTGSFDETPNFAPVVLHGPVMNSENIYCLLLLFTVHIYLDFTRNACPASHHAHVTGGNVNKCVS